MDIAKRIVEQFPQFYPCISYISDKNAFYQAIHDEILEAIARLTLDMRLGMEMYCSRLPAGYAHETVMYSDKLFEEYNEYDLCELEDHCYFSIYSMKFPSLLSGITSNEMCGQLIGNHVDIFDELSGYVDSEYNISEQLRCKYIKSINMYIKKKAWKYIHDEILYFAPNGKNWRDDMLNVVPSGYTMKSCITYKKQFWHDLHMSIQCFPIYGIEYAAAMLDYNGRCARDIY